MRFAFTGIQFAFHVCKSKMGWWERRFNYRNNPIWIILSEFVEQEKSEDVFLPCLPRAGLKRAGICSPAPRPALSLCSQSSSCSRELLSGPQPWQPPGFQREQSGAKYRDRRDSWNEKSVIDDAWRKLIGQLTRTKHLIGSTDRNQSWREELELNFRCFVFVSTVFTVLTNVRLIIMTRPRAEIRTMETAASRSG